ncbi:hypothetical protein TWF506_003903 [Arthrobotrys conoides]|uniref:Uncharacterized protein n=1 Tax=Arthrobotrys conoides TaxID=74498 RepID=A0AAN8MX66_9PEZI
MSPRILTKKNKRKERAVPRSQISGVAKKTEKKSSSRIFLADDVPYAPPSSSRSWISRVFGFNATRCREPPERCSRFHVQTDFARNQVWDTSQFLGPDPKLVRAWSNLAPRRETPSIVKVGNIRIPEDAILVEEEDVLPPLVPMSRLEYALLRRPYLPPVPLFRDQAAQPEDLLCCRTRHSQLPEIPFADDISNWIISTEDIFCTYEILY